MLRIAICDDDKILVTQIEEMLNRYLDKKMIDRYIEIFYDGASLERIYEKGDRFDIIYLDIAPTVAKQKKQQRRARQKKETRDNLAKEEILQDDRFFFIAGHTS